ncbi:TetR/AcrR family transcriptional regulator [Bacillus sp. AGMB 02131]|uniref:TetR/AcrR family transcriptional regulator n=1 Tax=Peribacillus faecalis TaxID=2772559 RepID=A0A927CZ25_9BACI|nr:TetR/AcrR family transcriptional regulator [Peribacillus faecalis]MBD3108375.1 TetR/AcrR family transcriptional regulator [Peribacillus faecalis]
MKKNKPKYKQIIDAAVIVIAEYGYHQAQVSKIAKQAGVADGTIYLYFKNKEDILISLFQEKMSEFVEKIEGKVAGIHSASEKLSLLITKHFDILASDPHLAIVTQLELRQSNKELRLKINAELKGYLALIDSVLKEGMENGEFKSDLNYKLARQMIFGTLDEIVTTWVMNEQKYQLQSLSTDVHNLILAGLAQAEKKS